MKGGKGDGEYNVIELRVTEWREGGTNVQYIIFHAQDAENSHTYGKQ